MSIATSTASTGAMTMADLAAAVLIFIGALFMFLAALGALRMPDLLTRMHATTKAGVFGAGLMLLGVMLYFGDGGVATRMGAILIFIILTSPVAAHAIGRAGYLTGSPLWEGTLKDDMKRRDEAALSREHRRE